MEQGTTPLDTSNRQIGGVGYSISPLEGLAKLAQTLSGRMGQNTANQGLIDALRRPQEQPQNGSAGDSQPNTLSPQNYQAGGQQGDMSSVPPSLLGYAAYDPEARKAIYDIMAKNAQTTNEQKNYGSQQDMRLPYKDNDESNEEAPF